VWTVTSGKSKVGVGVIELVRVIVGVRVIDGDGEWVGVSVGVLVGRGVGVKAGKLVEVLDGVKTGGCVSAWATNLLDGRQAVPASMTPVKTSVRDMARVILYLNIVGGIITPASCCFL
jgi:hypothetical protein